MSRLDDLFAKLSGFKITDDRGGDFGPRRLIPKPSPGETLVLRFLPRRVHLEILKSGGSPEEGPAFIHMVYLHSWRSRVDASITRFVVCPKTADPKAPCPICSYSALAYQNGDRDEGSTFRRYRSYLVNAAVIRFTSPEEESRLEPWVGRIGVFQMGAQLHEQVEKETSKYGSELFSPGLGRNFVVVVKEKKTSAGTFPSYTKSYAQEERTYLHEELGISEEELLEMLEDLPEPAEIYDPTPLDEIESICLEEEIDPRVFQSSVSRGGAPANGKKDESPRAGSPDSVEESKGEDSGSKSLEKKSSKLDELLAKLGS